MKLMYGVYCIVICIMTLHEIYQFESWKNIVWLFCWTGLMGDNTNTTNLTNWWRLDSRHANVTYENMSEVSFSLDQLALNSWHVGNKMTDRRSPLWHKATHNPNNVDKKQHLRRQWQSSAWPTTGLAVTIHLPSSSLPSSRWKSV